MVCVSIFAEGQVQGVGFRWTVANTAKDLKLSGLVRNLRDGRVQIHLEGDKETINQFIKVIRTHTGVIDGLHPRVDELRVSFEGEDGYEKAWRSYSGFEIDPNRG
jgi:acylphosphatase